MSGNFAILMTAVLWSTAGMLVKLLPWGAFSVARARGFVCLIFLFLVQLIRKRGNVRKALPRLNRQNMVVGFFMFATSTCYITAIRLTTAANAIVLQYIAPMLVLLYAIVFKHRKCSRAELLLAMITFGGCVVAFAGEMGTDGMLGNLFAILSGFALAGQIVASSQEGVDAVEGMMIGCVLSGCCFAAFLAKEDPATFTLSTIVTVILLGAFQYGLANLCYAHGVRTADSVHVALVLTLEPVLAPVWTYLSTHEKPSILSICGLVIVVLSITLYSVLEAKNKRAVPKPLPQESQS